jgi:hypothetical protein
MECQVGEARLHLEEIAANRTVGDSRQMDSCQTVSLCLLPVPFPALCPPTLSRAEQSRRCYRRRRSWALLSTHLRGHFLPWMGIVIPDFPTSLLRVFCAL